MVFDKNFKDVMGEEKDKIKGMDFKHKLSYFKSYYLAPVLIIAAIIVIAFLIIYDTQINNVRVYYSGVTIAVDISEEGKKYLSTDFDEVAEHKRKYKAFIYDEIYIPQSDDRTKVDGLDYVDLVLGESIAGGEFNYFIIDEDMIDHYDSMNFFNDIKEIADAYNISQNDRYIGKDGNVVAVRLNEDICAKLGLKAWDVCPYYAQIHPSGEAINDEIFLDRLLGNNN